MRGILYDDYVIKELSVLIITTRYNVVRYAINDIGDTSDQEVERVDDSADGRWIDCTSKCPCAKY